MKTGLQKSVFYSDQEEPSVTLIATNDGITVDDGHEDTVIYLPPHIVERIVEMWEDWRHHWEPLAREWMER